MEDSFEGGVGDGGAGQPSARARVAIHGSNLSALTGDKTFRIPLARCSLEGAGRRILVRDEQSSLVIWSDAEGFLHALERAQHGTLTDQVRRLRRAARRKRLIKWCSFALIAAGAMSAASVPITRWAVGGGVPSLANGIGESALEQLALQPGVAPTAEQALGGIAERLRLTTAPPTRSFRLLLADYDEVHSFSVPPGTVVVTAGLVCEADGPEVVMAVVARELAHLESQDTIHRVAETVDFRTTLDLAHGDVSVLRARMLDFADPKRCPEFTPEQKTAANHRATAMLTQAGLVPSDVQDLAALTTPTAARRPGGKEVGRIVGIQGLDWSKVRAEACELIGR